MDANVNSTDRTPRDYVLFALGFLGFLVAGGGIEISSPFLTVIGAGILLFSVLCFYRAQA